VIYVERTAKETVMSQIWLSLLSLALATDADTDETHSVVGGSQVSPGDWEDAAAVYFGNSVGCTGVLIASNVVLTAGHCTGGISKVKVGTNDYTQGGETIQVQQTHEYPNSYSTYDIAVLILAEDAETEPRIIAQDCILEEDFYDGAKVTIVGYGATDNYGYQYGSELNEADTTVDDHDCTTMQLGCNSQVSPGGEVGAGGSDAIDSCYGDSGGPLYLQTDRGDFLVGITSRGYNTSSVPCGEGGIYARPDAIIDWIEQKANVTLPTPDCTNNTPPDPIALPLVVFQGEEGLITIQPNDPDPGDTHTFSVAEDPEYGTIFVNNAGNVIYEAPTNYVGEDDAVIVVTDAAGAAVEVTIDIEVVEADSNDDDDDDEGGSGLIGGCACSSNTISPIHVGWVMFAALIGVRRR